MKTYEVLFVTPHGNGWAIVNSDTVDSVRSILENQSKFQPLDILHIKERKVICGLNTSIIYEGHCETLMSPYDLAVSQGYEGSLEEWLESLKGESAYEIWLDQGHTGTEEDFLDWLRDLSSTSLQELNDVNVDSPSDNQALIYNSTTQKWENKAIPDGAFVFTLTVTYETVNEEQVASITCDKSISEIIDAIENDKNVAARYYQSQEDEILIYSENIEHYGEFLIVSFNFIVYGGAGVIWIEGHIDNNTDVWSMGDYASYMSQSNVDKLQNIEDGAQVNVQSDWNESDNSSDAYIKNKPTIPTVNDATLTIKQGSSTLGTFTANQSTDANISIPQHTHINYINGIFDYDGNEYHEVTIGTQTWLIENLKTTHYLDGTEIPYNLSGGYDPNSPSFYYPNNNSTNKSDYGLLYNWYVINNGISQSNNFIEGYHVPSYSELQILVSYIESQYPNTSAKALASTFGWINTNEANSPGNNQSENNLVEFSATPSGVLFYYPFAYDSFGADSVIWTSTLFAPYNDSAYGLLIGYNYNYIIISHNSLSNGSLIRLIKNTPQN